jgi:hypothetical protein
MTTPSDPQAAARDVIAQVIADGKSMMVPARVEWTDEAKAEQILAALASAGLVITAPDAAERSAGEVVIDMDTAQWAAVAFSHAPWADDPDTQRVVRKATEALNDAIDAALAAGSDPA